MGILFAPHGIRVTPAIAQCERIAVPVIVGIIKPTILFPVSVLSELSAAQLEAVLVHELAHLSRWDHVANLVPAAKVAERLDTTIWAVRGWEENRYMPKVQHIRRIIVFLGRVPKEIQPRTPADQMKLYRGILGLEQKELAALLGVADTSISRWENGKYPPPDEYLEKLKSLADIAQFTR